MEKITLIPMEFQLGVCKLSPKEEIPKWAYKNKEFTSITYTDDELSIVCMEEDIPKGVEAELGWKVLKIKGQLDFSLVGILASVIKPLTENSISVFTISTYNTDYILIKEDQFEKGIELLKYKFNIEELFFREGIVWED